MKMPFSKRPDESCFADLAKLEQKAADLGQRRDVYNRYEASLKSSIDDSRLRFNETPTEGNLKTLHAAIAAHGSLKQTGLFMDCQNSATHLSEAMLCTSEALDIYRRCLESRLETVRQERAQTVQKLKAAFADAGDAHADIEAVPVVQGLTGQVNGLESLIARIGMASASPIEAHMVRTILAVLHGSPAPVPPTAAMPSAMAFNGGVGQDSPQPEAPRRSLLPESWMGIRPGPGQPPMPPDARPLGGGLF